MGHVWPWDYVAWWGVFETHLLWWRVGDLEWSHQWISTITVKSKCGTLFVVYLMSFKFCEWKSMAVTILKPQSFINWVLRLPIVPHNERDILIISWGGCWYININIGLSSMKVVHILLVLWMHTMPTHLDKKDIHPASTNVMNQSKP